MPPEVGTPASDPGRIDDGATPWQRILGVALVTVVVVGVGSVAVAASGPAVGGTASSTLGAVECHPGANDTFLAGCLDAGSDDETDWSASGTYRIPNGTDRVVITLSGPESADFELYVTMDGRTPSVDDFDRKAGGEGSTERIVVEDDAFSAGTRIGVMAYAYNGSGAFEVSVRRVPDPEASLSGPAAARRNESVTFDATASVVPNPPAAYVWTVDGREVERGRDGTLTYAFAAGGTHEVAVTVEGTNGTSATATMSVAVGPDAVETTARIDVLADAPVWVNQTVRLSAARSSADPGGIASYEWRVGGRTLTGETVAYTANAPGTYNVTLTVVDEAGGVTNATTTIRVRRADVRIEDVRGATSEIVPDHLFANCSKRIRVAIGGSQPVERVEFTLGGTTVTDANGSDGWAVAKRRLPTNDSDLLRITAVGVGGATDGETVRVPTARAPKGLRKLVSVYGDEMTERGTAASRTPLVVDDCTFVVRYPQVARDIPSIPTVGDGDIVVPTNLTQFVKAISDMDLSANFELRYHPGMDQVSIGGGGVYEMGLNPVGESTLRVDLEFVGYFSLPNFTLQSFRVNGYKEAEIYLEGYLVPVVPSTHARITLPFGVGPDPLLAVDIDPLDALLNPRIDFRGRINDQFELSTLHVEAQGTFTVRGQVGNDCWVNPVAIGCLALRAWAQATIQSPYMGVVPFEPKLQGTATAEMGYQVRAPTNLVDDVTKTWQWQWNLSAATRLAPAATSVGPNDRAHAGLAADPALTLVSRTDRGPGPKRTDSPGAALLDRREDDSRADTGALRPAHRDRG